jgi:hypothetical protein
LFANYAASDSTTGELRHGVIATKNTKIHKKKAGSFFVPVRVYRGPFLHCNTAAPVNSVTTVVGRSRQEMAYSEEDPLNLEATPP